MGQSPRPEPELVHRVTAAWRNDLENTPAFLSLAASYVLLGGTAPSLFSVSIAYVGFRVFQAYAQIRALQPHRTIGFLGGVLASLALVVLIGARIWGGAP
jgi:prostaglandin-E synthase 1